ncbi:hypothetical protein quinque_015960, partial [Culex quinquefasciatus]
EGVSIGQAHQRGASSTQQCVPLGRSLPEPCAPDGLGRPRRSSAHPDESVTERTLDYTRYGLTVNDRINPFGLVNTGASSTITTEQLQDLLQTMYCGTTSIELAFIEDEHEREWLAEQYERSFQTTLASIEKREIAKLLLQSQAFDNFVATKFPTVKRYGGEGAESIMAFYRQLFRCAAEADLTNVVVGMPHRGKLNVLTTLFQTRPAKIFRKFKGLPEFPEG